MNIRCRNFKILKDFECNIPYNGLTLLCGRNGSGKTSVMELVHAGITGRGFNKGLNQLVTETEKDGYIDIEFEHKGSTYTISRIFGKTSKATAMKDSVLVADSATSVKSLVENIYPNQDLIKISFLKDVDLKTFLLNIIKIDVIQKRIQEVYNEYQQLKKLLQEKMLIKTSALNRETQRYDSAKANIDELLDSIKKLELELFEEKYSLEELERISQAKKFVEADCISIKDEYLKKLRNEFDSASSTYMKEMNQISQKISDLKLQKQQLATTLEKSIYSLFDNEISSINNQLETLNTEKTQITSEIMKLNDETKEVESSYSTETRSVENKFNSEVNQLNLLIKDYENKVGYLKMQIAELDSKMDSVISKGVCPECLREVEDAEVIKEKYSKKKEVLSNEVNEKQQSIDEMKHKISELEVECKEKLVALKDSYNNKKILFADKANKIREVLNQIEPKIKELQNSRRALLDAKNSNNIQVLLQINPDIASTAEDLKNKMNDLQQIDEQLNSLQNERQQKEVEYKKMKDEYESATSTETINKYISQIINEQLLPKYGISMLDLCMDVDEEIKKINHNKMKKIAIEERRRHLDSLQEDLNKIESEVSLLQKELEQLNQEDVQLNEEIRCIEFLKNTRALNKYIFSRVSSTINDTLKSFNVLMQVELDIDDNDNVSLYAINVNGYRVHESYLSAGETVMMRLSLYLVLKKMFDPDFNYLFIDETLDKLDEQNAKSVVDLLKNFSNSMSVVVVTHKRDLQSYDIWDNIIDMG